MNLARFTINGSPSTAGGFDVDPGIVPSLRLEASSSLVGRVTFEVHSSTGGPRASYQAPLLTLNNGITTGQAVDAATPSSTVTISAGVPGFRAAHTWEIRCKVNGGTNSDGSVNPDYVFSRYLVMRSSSLRRKILASERFEYDPDESWAGAFNELVDEESAESSAEGLLELLDADIGVTTYGGNITEWRGNRGHIARPITNDQQLDYATLSGGRRAVAFNGTTQGMTLELPELRRNNSSLIIAVQFYPLSTSSSQKLAQLWKTEDSTSILHVGIEGPVYGGWAANNNDTVAYSVKTGADPLNTETVVECARVPATTYAVVCYANGALVSPIGNVDVLSPQPTSTTVSIGCSIGSSGDYYHGLIRRIAIYGHTRYSQMAANAAARHAQWIGN